MREHKYKAYHKEKKVIRDVVYIDFENKWVGVNYNNNQVAWNFWDIELMEYTGLKDKNGVEIYEGYIVKVTDDDEIDELDSNIGIGKINAGGVEMVMKKKYEVVHEVFQEVSKTVWATDEADTERQAAQLLWYKYPFWLKECKSITEVEPTVQVNTEGE